MGRPPKPTALLRLEKGKLYDEQREREEVEPKAHMEIRPRCPKRFSKEERKEWKNIAGALKNLGLFSMTNAIQLELLATVKAEYNRACEAYFASGKIQFVKGADGNPMYNPHLNALLRLGPLVDRYSQNLGLGSMATARVGALIVKSKRQKSEMESLMD